MSSARRSHQQRAAAPIAVDRVLSLSQFAEAAGFSKSTAKRLVREGLGPIITRVSPRRRGVRISDFQRWLDSRAITSTSKGGN